ncbi:MAG TPA: hypothetical protein VGL72_00585 [Bryobacteraceae bacterium]|jgi:hypothetical protein
MRVIVFGLLTAGLVYADFSYEETSRITGGALVAMMKFAGAFSKDARRANEPIHSTIAIKGNRMVRKSDFSASITDLDAETITTINFEKKTYYTMTFAQMKQAMEQASEQMKNAQTTQPDSSGTPPPDMKFDVKVNDTGQTKTINGLPTHEMVMTMTMQATDQQSGTKGGMDISTDSWLTPTVPGYEEIRHFYRRMAEKLNWVPGPGGMLNRPDIARGMSELYKEGAKMDGVPVMQIIKMGGNVQGAPQNGDSSQPPPQSSSSSSSSSAPPTSVGSAIGSALGGRFGLGRKKQPQQNSDSSSSQSASSSNSGNASGSLMEMTIELTSYSSAPVDTGLFAIPAGFRLVEPDMNTRPHAKPR